MVHAFLEADYAEIILFDQCSINRTNYNSKLDITKWFRCFCSSGWNWRTTQIVGEYLV